VNWFLVSAIFALIACLIPPYSFTWNLVTCTVLALSSYLLGKQ